MTSKAHSIIGHDTDGSRPEHDWYPTPAEATHQLLDQYDPEFWGERILEPAAGDGAMTEVLHFRFPRKYIIKSDIEPRAPDIQELDFFSAHFGQVSSVITNPPFRFAEQFVRTALDTTRGMNGTVAMLCRLAFLESKRRKVLFEETPLKRVHVFSWRVPMWRNGIVTGDGKGKMMAYAWYVWDWKHPADERPTLGWL